MPYYFLFIRVSPWLAIHRSCSLRRPSSGKLFPKLRMVKMHLDIRHTAPTAALKVLVLGVRQTRYTLWKKNWDNSPRYYMWLLMAGGREVGDGGLRAHAGPGGTDGEGPLLFGHGQTWRTTTSLQKEMHLLRLGDGLVTSDLVLDTTLVAFTMDFSIVFHHSHEFFLYSSYSVSPL